MDPISDQPSDFSPLEREVGLNKSFFNGSQNRHLLVKLKPLIDQHAHTILEACHRHLVPLSSDHETIVRLKALQAAYLETLTSGEVDPEWTSLLREQIDLAPQLVMESYSTIYSQIVSFVSSEFEAIPTEKQAILSALIKVFFIDMSSAMEAHARTISGRQALHMLNLREGLEQQSIRLEDSRARFRSIFENVSIPLVTYDRAGKITRWNRPFEALLERSHEKLEGQHFFEVIAEKNTQERTQSMVDAVFRGENLTEIHWKIKTSSDMLRDLSVSTFPVYAAIGIVSFGIAAFVDMTEKNELERALLHTDKMAAMGTLASGLAHELGTPMNVILGRSESLLRHTKEESTAKGLMIIIEQVDRMTHLINRLLAFARKTPIERKKIGMNTLIHKSIEIVEQRASAKGIVISVDLEEPLCPIWGEGEQILQALVNLMMNAVDAIHQAGEISIKTSEISMSGKYSPRPGTKSSLKHMIQILVKDNGSGIDPSYLDKIFDPFFTTKAVGKGTGLGLAVTSGIVQEHGGQIEVASSGRGTTFCIRLPAEKE